MPTYLLSTHSVEGEDRPERTDEQMQEMMGRISALEDDLRAAGSWRFSARLHEPDSATVVRRSSGETVTTDGPFAESKEHIAGFYVIEADDLDAALEWAARTSEAIDAPIEVRPFAGFQDD